MKRIVNFILIIACILLLLDILYVVTFFNSFNILHFLVMIIFLPSVLISLIIACILHLLHVDQIKLQCLFSAISSLIFTMIMYFLTYSNKEFIEKIIANSTQLTQSSSINISNISVNTNLSSFILIFIIVFVFSVIFNTILNVLKEGRKANVY